MYIAAVDGGGTKTVAVVADTNGNIRGRGQTGCGNHQINGIHAAIVNVEAAIREAVFAANVADKDIAYVHYSLAGADRTVDEQVLKPALASLPFSSWNLTSDAWSSLRMGTTDGLGVAVVCGSGTNCVARTGSGEEIQIGGFGYLFGDRAGGYYLAQQAFHYAVRCFDGREAGTSLIRLLPAYFHYDDMAELISAALDEAWDEVPVELAVTVHEAAAEGDAVACRLLANMGTELGRAAVAAIRKFTKDTSETVPVILTGSILQKGRSKHLLRALLQEIRRAGIHSPVRIPRGEPVYGAILLAADAMGLDIKRPQWDVVEPDGTINVTSE